MSGQIRQDLSAGEVQAAGGVVGTGSDPKDLRDLPAPYEVDGVNAAVSLDRTTGAVRVNAHAYTGTGSTALGGYVERSASARGASTVKRMEACAP